MSACNCDKCKAAKECDRSCACPEPILDVYENPYEPGVVTFNDNGLTTKWDARHLITSQQTDTSISADAVKRVLRYMAERHIDTISARELGQILHLADIGDVNGKKLTQGSLLTYNKSNDCAEGCVGTRNTWDAWNAIDGQDDSAYYPIAADQKGNLASITPPSNPNKNYFLGWAGKRQLGYFTVKSGTAKPINGGPVYFDEDSGELIYVKG